MTTLWILLGGALAAALVIYASIKMGFRFDVRTRPAPGTIIQVGLGHRYAVNEHVEIDGEFYVITGTSPRSITIGTRQ